jgi:alpha-amylase
MKKRGFFLLLIITWLVAACGGPATPSPTSTETPCTTTCNWWDNTVFYEIFMRSFYDSNGDGIGDFNGLTQKLDYLNDSNPKTTSDLGITGIWLMPIHPSPSYHGYDVTDYREINPEYGTLQDFQNFLKEAHKRGIRVIIDLVINHTSDQHPWFKEAQDPNSPKRNWYIWSNVDYGYPPVAGVAPWHASPNGYYYGAFSEHMPDLNYRNPEVTQEMESIAKYWVDMGVDGFRIDAAKHLIEEGKDKQVNAKSTFAWFKDFRTFLQSVKPDVFTVGEVRDSTSIARQYAPGDGINMVFDFTQAQGIISAVNDRNGPAVRGAIQYGLTTFGSSEYATFLTNHDDPRVMGSFNGDINKMKAAAAIYLTAPGTPFIYYGEEIGMQGVKPDELIRSPMQWAGDNGTAGFTTGKPWEEPYKGYQEVNVAQQDKDPSSLLNHYRALVNLREQQPVLRKGGYFPAKIAPRGLYAAIRATDREAVLILVNLTDNPIAIDGLAGELTGWSGTYALPPLFGQGTSADLTVTDGNYSGFIPASNIPANAIWIFKLAAK